MKTPQPQFSHLPEQDLELLSAYLDDQLDAPARSDLEQRLDREPRLRFELEELRTTTALLHDLPTLTPPRSFTLDPATVQPRRSHYAGWALAWAGQLGSGLAGLMLILLASLQMLGGMGSPMAAAPAPAMAPAPMMVQATPAPMLEMEPAAGMAMSAEATAPPEADAGVLALPAETETPDMLPNADMVRQTEPNDAEMAEKSATPETVATKEAPAPSGVPPVFMLLLGLVLVGVAGVSWAKTSGKF